jgi:ribonuclease HI
MWQKLDILIQGKNIEWNWTKWHASDYRNNYVDKKARALVA